jgi:Cytochrome c7 and related cytochrome c
VQSASSKLCGEGAWSLSGSGLNRWIRVVVVLGVIVLGGALLIRALPAQDANTPVPPSASPSSEESSPVFTVEHRSVAGAVKEFFGMRATPVQPIAYTHKVHLAKGLQCTFCHAGVDQGPDARIPSVSLCMTCHQVIATDKPEIKKLAAYKASGEEVPWQRVYGFEPSAHVKFNHAPHIRAGVDCATCHGDLHTMTVAERKVDHTMGFCVQCHKQNNAPIDCVTCHF